MPSDNSEPRSGSYFSLLSVISNAVEEALELDWTVERLLDEVKEVFEEKKNENARSYSDRPDDRRT